MYWQLQNEFAKFAWVTWKFPTDNRHDSTTTKLQNYTRSSLQKDIEHRIPILLNTKNMTMSLSITLAHFCDIHGPRSILCTVKIPAPTASTAASQPISPNQQDHHPLSPPPTTTTTDKNKVKQPTTTLNFSKESYCASCLLTTPSESSPTGGPTTLRTSIDDTQYITTQYSTKTYRALNSLIRKALSEEYANYEKDSPPYILKDDIRGVSLIQAFRVWDLEARGSFRRFCFIVNESFFDENDPGNESIILKNFDMIRNSLSVMVHELTEMNTRVRFKDMGGFTNDGEREVGENNDLYLRGRGLKANGLRECVGDDNVFVKQHLWFVKILSRCV